MRSDTAVNQGGILRPVADSDPIKSRIEQVLALRGWSARELSQRSNLSENHVAQILSRGARRVGHETLSKIAAGGGVRVTWLTSGEEPMEAAGVSPNAAPAEESDPCMGNRPGFEAALVGARALRPHHPEYVWREVRVSDPLMVIPLTPAALADIADVLVKYVAPPPSDIPRQEGPRKRRSS